MFCLCLMYVDELGLLMRYVRVCLWGGEVTACLFLLLLLEVLSFHITELKKKKK